MTRNRQLILDSVLLGIVGGLSAQLFVLCLGWSENFFMVWLAGYTPPGLPEHGGAVREAVGSYGLWLIPVATTLGGLISGVLVYSLAPEAEGHGTDSAVKAYHQAGGFLRYRIPPLKMIASAITIGSGGAAGREGPTALVSAGIGSIYASLQKRSDEDRRLLLLIGMGAGLSAIFRSPIGCAIFAVEVLYRDMEYESTALLYAILASCVAYVVNALFVGWQPLFRVPAGLKVFRFSDYGWFLILGAASGLVATLLPMVFYGMRDAFHALPGPPHIKPAIGGLGVGLLALVLPQVLGGGYGWIQEAIDGKLAASILLALVFAKILALGLTVSSGGSGGIFAPCLFVGAMLGGFLAKVFGLSPPEFAIVGIVAVFGAAARVPFATLLMVVEMTGGFELLIPAAVALTVSYFIQEGLSAHLKYKSLYEAQVPSRIDSPAHQAEHVKCALMLLEEQEMPSLIDCSHVNLVALLRSGVPIYLPGGKHLFIHEITNESPLAGKAADRCQVESWEEAEITAIIRKGEVVLPHPGFHIAPGDKLLILSSVDFTPPGT
jgi:CIC family chloride channel protein